MANNDMLENEFEEINVVGEKKESLWDKTKSTYNKAKDSKICKFLGKAALIGAGALGTMMILGRAKDDVIDPNCLDDIVGNNDETEN